MPKSRAAYMRAYRKRKAGVDPHRALAESVIETLPVDPNMARNSYGWLKAENARLTEEVVRLKRALAQANRDAILRKVNTHR